MRPGASARIVDGGEFDEYFRAKVYGTPKAKNEDEKVTQLSQQGQHANVGNLISYKTVGERAEEGNIKCAEE